MALGEYESQSKKILEKTLSYSGLGVGEEIDYRAVSIGEGEHLHEIYTLHQPSSELPHIVFLHGFGATSMSFIRLFKRLRGNYQVHALDQLGVGHSSRSNFSENFSFNEAKDYFVDAIEKWRKEVGVNSFILAGHSFGAYIAALYFQKHTQNVSKLVLLSPLGSSSNAQGLLKKQLLKKAGGGLKGHLYLYFFQKLTRIGLRPSSIMKSYYFGEKLIDYIICQRFRLTGEEKAAWKSYYRDIAKFEKTSEYSIYIFFEWPLKPKESIQSILRKIDSSTPIEFYFGEQDWMVSIGAQRLSQEYSNVSLARVSKAGHQLSFDNPEEVCEKISVGHGGRVNTIEK